MRLSRSVVIAAFLALGAVPAQAQVDTLFSGTYTGGNEFNTTASITLAYDFVSNGVYEFYLDVENQGIYGEVYRAIGLFHLPSYTLLDWSGPTGWHLPPPNDFSGDGLTPETVDLVSPDPGPAYGLHVGESASFTFTLSGFTNNGQLQSVGAGIHAISGPYGCSTKMGVQSGSVVGTAPAPGDCSNTVPEPATIVLLASGFLGLLGFAYVRHAV